MTAYDDVPYCEQIIKTPAKTGERLGMKPQIALNVLQVILLLFLTYKVLSDGEPSDSVQQESRLPSLDYVVETPMKGVDLQEDRLRQIIREELAQQVRAISNSQDLNKDVASATPADSAEYEKRFNDVAQKIEYFESAGVISDSEMYQLQSEIARLDKQGRQEMFGRLVRALNTGDIDGRL